MELNFDRNCIGLDGEPIKDTITGEVINLSKALANNLANSISSPDVLKFYDWSKSLFRDGKLTVDRSDFQKLKTFIETVQGISVLIRAQWLECMVLSPE
jgi:hypothetical protein